MKIYQIQRSRIVYEVLNTEVIVVDFDTGNYYALAHVAKQVWQLIERKTPVGQIARLIAEHYQLAADRVLKDVEQLIEELAVNELIAPCEENSAEPVQVVSDGLSYEAPKLQKYTDVQNLLLLDPIHEVTEVGWPDKSIS